MENLIETALASVEGAAYNFDNSHYQEAQILATIAQAEAAAAIAWELRRMNDRLDSMTSNEGQGHDEDGNPIDRKGLRVSATTWNGDTYG